MTMPDTSLTDPSGEQFMTRVVDITRRGLTVEFPLPAHTLALTAAQQRDYLRDRIYYTLRHDLLAERLPTRTLRFTPTHPRWATWWDHLKATYRMRWWAAWWVRRHPPRHVDEPVPVVVDVQAAWTYPHAPVPGGLGYSVLKVDTPTTYWGYPR
jgi:hypothetical protein